MWTRLLASSSSMKRTAAIAAFAFIPLLIGACGDKDAQDTVEPETPQIAEGSLGPTLTALRDAVEYRLTEGAPLIALEEEQSVDLLPGANIVVGENARAELSWPGFIENELLTGADTLISLSLPSEREAILDQAAGTAVYRVRPAGEGAGSAAADAEAATSDAPTKLQVIAGWITVDVDEAPTEVVVSFIPGAEPAAWVAVLEGAASVAGGDGALTELSAGAAAGFTADGPAPIAHDIDLTRLDAWLARVADGDAQGSIATVAFRCTVAVDQTALLQMPDATLAEDATDSLSEGSVVDVRERDDSGQWLRVETLIGAVEGWVLAADLECSGPVTSLPQAVAPGDEELPTPTAVPLPTRPLVLPTAITPIATPTRTATPTPAAEANISFSASKKEITAGECVTIKWSVENIRAVYYNGDGKTGSGEEKECPTSTTTYTLKVELLDGSTTERTITIKVKPKEEPTAVPEPTDVPASATPVPASPTTAPPTPTSVPTAEPPPPTDVPTDEPPEPTDEPTSEPAPTIEPLS